MILLFFLITLSAIHTAHSSSPSSCLVESNSTTCPSGCRLLASLPDAEIVAEFTCADGSIHRCTAPYAQVATSVQRSLMEPMWTTPGLTGTYRTNTLGDGWYTPECAVSSFQGEGRLLESSIPEAGCTGDELYACVCPVPTEAPDTNPELKIRTTNTTYTLGTGVGYNTSSGTFTVYAAGYYVISSNTYRDIVSLTSESTVQAEAAEWALRDTNSSLLQITEGAVEHEMGSSFQWNGSALIIPHRSIWEFVVPEGNVTTFVWGNDNNTVESVSTQAWCARWIDVDVVVSVYNTTSFFIRDVLPSRIS